MPSLNIYTNTCKKGKEKNVLRKFVNLAPVQSGFKPIILRSISATRYNFKDVSTWEPSGTTSSLWKARGIQNRHYIPIDGHKKMSFSYYIIMGLK